MIKILLVLGIVGLVALVPDVTSPSKVGGYDSTAASLGFVMVRPDDPISSLPRALGPEEQFCLFWGEDIWIHPDHGMDGDVASLPPIAGLYPDGAVPEQSVQISMIEEKPPIVEDFPLDLASARE